MEVPRLAAGDPSWYDDKAWTALTRPWTNNPRNLTTLTSLYAGNYGYHTGSLIYRGHFVANGGESTLFLNVSGGTGFGHSVWLNGTFLGGGVDGREGPTDLRAEHILPQPPFTWDSVRAHRANRPHGARRGSSGDGRKQFPRGILSYSLSGHGDSPADITWKMTGNLGGKQYRDVVRGPLNEGALYAERQGFHLPGAPAWNWTVLNPVTEGIPRAGVGFFATTFDLHIPEGYDVSMRVVFNSSSSSSSSATTSRSSTVIKGQNYRCQLYINGYQFGKYGPSPLPYFPFPPVLPFHTNIYYFIVTVNNIGPQTSFPIPEGILNHHGRNYIALTLWALDAQGARIGGLELLPSLATSASMIRSGYRKPGLVWRREEWRVREGAY